MTQQLMSNAVKEVIQQGEVIGNNYYLPNIVLEKDLYHEVRKALESIRGKWSGKKEYWIDGQIIKGAFVFPESLDTDKVIQGLVESEYLPSKNIHDYYHTPEHVVHTMLESVYTFSSFGTVLLDEKVKVLEPSAGTGGIVDILAQHQNLDITAVEIDPVNYHILKAKGYENVINDDFLDVDIDEQFDLVIMNPPFNAGKQKDVYMSHIRKAHSLLKPNGQLVAITPPNWLWRDNIKYKQFAEWVYNHTSYAYSPIPLGKQFKNTGIDTCIIVLEAKPIKDLYEPHEGYSSVGAYNFAITLDSEKGSVDKVKNAAKRIPLDVFGNVDSSSPEFIVFRDYLEEVRLRFSKSYWLFWLNDDDIYDLATYYNKLDIGE